MQLLREKSSLSIKSIMIIIMVFQLRVMMSYSND
jgi:hypothetical protein